MSKKLLCTLLLLTFGLFLIACGNDKPTNETTATDQTNYSQLSVTAVSKLKLLSLCAGKERTKKKTKLIHSF